MAIVQLIRMLSKNNLTTYQMNSPQVFAYESDQFHRIFLEFLIIEERSIQISQFIKVHIKRKPTTTNEKPLQPSPQVCIIIYLPIQNSNLCNDPPCIYLFQVCTQVLSDISNTLATLCSNWFPRISFDPKFPCTCGSVCDDHKIVGCAELECLHLVKLGSILLFQKYNKLLYNFTKFLLLYRWSFDNTNDLVWI